MTYHDDFILSAALLDQGSLEQLSTQGLGALPDLFPVLLNAAMQIERRKYLGAAPHGRTEERTGHANGYKDKTLNTRLPVLGFYDANTSRSVHGLHAFAAKFPPQLAAWAIETYSQPGQTVCDLMMGSGTTLVAAGRLGREAVDFDLDPMACPIT